MGLNKGETSNDNMNEDLIRFLRHNNKDGSFILDLKTFSQEMMNVK